MICSCLYKVNKHNNTLFWTAIGKIKPIADISSRVTADTEFAVHAYTYSH